MKHWRITGFDASDKVIGQVDVWGTLAHALAFAYLTDLSEAIYFYYEELNDGLP